MHVVADTNSLLADGIITESQATEITRRGREAMVQIVVHGILIAGILAATGGLIFYLADALSVALAGAIFMAGGWLIGRQGANMFSRAGAIIGAGLLIGGGSLELLTNYEPIAGPALLAGGAALGAILWRSAPQSLVAGAMFLMGIAAHLAGLAHWLSWSDTFAGPLPWLYATGIIAAAGWRVDVRFVTALAIVPFAQALDTTTAYWHATYAFYSPESTLTILQMTAAIAACLWLAPKRAERQARHLGIFALMAFIVANLCALVGSLWGDYVGEYVWGPGYFRHWDTGWQAYDGTRAEFRETALYISENVYSILWAVVLAAIMTWSALTTRRGLFNTTVTFALIHGYTQLFETFSDEPLTYALGGLGAIPLAWGIWRANQRLSQGA
ncbi:MAG: hypothetical protein AAGA15_13435 [Pseudomonadota bacterium]